mgnify:CR=1 FL=1
MSETFRLTAAAETDIEDILTHSAETWGVAQAIAYHGVLLNRMRWLVDNPSSGRPRPELSEALRSYPEGRHMLYYRIEDQGIIIVRVKHQSSGLAGDWDTQQ